MYRGRSVRPSGATVTIQTLPSPDAPGKGRPTTRMVVVVFSRGLCASYFWSGSMRCSGVVLTCCSLLVGVGGGRPGGDGAANGSGGGFDGVRGGLADDAALHGRPVGPQGPVPGAVV